MQVPLLKQTKSACGPTSLAMVLKYFKTEVPLNEIIKHVGGIKKYGVRIVSLAEYAKKLGFKVYCYSYNKKMSKGNAEIRKPDKKLILNFLKKRLPVIIAVRTFLLRNLEFNKEGHLIVITKYQNGIFWYNDPSYAKKLTIKENDLIFAWHNNILDSSAYMLVLEPK
ncbi:C39 family peptidase [Candidatus Parcubacteria bacterium]|nr:C39 family peptidase [Candidatus Parcubacteria bacterium]